MSKKSLLKIVKWFGGIILSVFLLVTALLYFFKDDICNLAINEANKHLNAKVQVAKVDLAFWGSFPNLSIDFNHVFIQDTYEGSTVHDTLLYSEKIRIKLNPIDLWNENYDIKAIEIKPGVLHLKVNAEGLTNYDIIKKNESDTTNDSLNIHLRKVNFEAVRFSYTNKATHQIYKAKITTLDLIGDFTRSDFNLQAVSKLTINAAQSGNINMVSNKKAAFNIQLKVNYDSNTVIFPKSTIFIAELPFSFEGKVDSTDYYFKLQGKNIKIQEFANKLFKEETKSIKKFSGTGNVIFDLAIDGKKGTKQAANVKCSFGIKNGTLKEPKSGISISKLNIDGNYSNVDGKEKEFLNLRKFNFKTNGGLFTGKLKITNFRAPIYEGSADGLINLKVLHEIFQLQGVQTFSGLIDVSSQYKIQAVPKNNEEFDYIIQKSNGQVKLKNVSLQLIDDKRIFNQINGITYLRNDQVGLNNIGLKINKSDFKINGVFKNLSKYFSHTGNLQANVELESIFIDLEDLGTDTKAEILETERSFLLPNDIEGKVYINIKNLKYGKHTYSKLRGNMQLKGRVLNFPKISISNGGAAAFGSIKIEERNPEFFYISSQLVSKNIDFKKIFLEWDNFQQDVILADNISGEMQANIKFSAPFDFRNGIIMSSIDAQIGIQINNGELKNVSTFKAITEGIKSSTTAKLMIGKNNINAFEKKLLNLKFKQLNNTIFIKNGIITIPKFSIESSALNIEASGKHTFDNEIDYRIGFRFRDLKAKQASEFGSIEDDKSGKFIFMRMYGTMDNPLFEWDKENSRDKRKENQEEAKKDAKSILKTEFGLFKNDTTVGTYIEEKKEHETLLIEYDPINDIDTIINVIQPKKETGLKKWFKESEKEAKKEKEEIISIEIDDL